MFDDHKLSSFFAHSLDNMAGFVQSSDMVQAHFSTSIRVVSPLHFLKAFSLVPLNLMLMQTYLTMVGWESMLQRRSETAF